MDEKAGYTVENTADPRSLTPEFIPLDPETWPRREQFWYFSQMAPTGYSVTVDVDVTAMRRTVKQNGLHFFPAYLWLITRTLNLQPEYRLAQSDGQMGHFTTLTPLYAVFHEDDRTFSMLWTPFCERFPAFYRQYLEDRQHYGGNHGILADKEHLPPPNAYTVSCVPWVPFRHFAVHSYDNKPYYFPSVEAGKFREEDGRVLMPLSVTCHHAAADGWHLHRFLETLQRDADHFEQFL